MRSSTCSMAVVPVTQMYASGICTDLHRSAVTLRLGFRELTLWGNLKPCGAHHANTVVHDKLFSEIGLVSMVAASRDAHQAADWRQRTSSVL